MKKIHNSGNNDKAKKKYKIRIKKAQHNEEIFNVKYETSEEINAINEYGNAIDLRNLLYSDTSDPKDYD